MDLAAFLPGQGQAKKVKRVACKILTSISLVTIIMYMKVRRQLVRLANLSSVMALRR